MPIRQQKVQKRYKSVDGFSEGRAQNTLGFAAFLSNKKFPPKSESHRVQCSKWACGKSKAQKNTFAERLARRSKNTIAKTAKITHSLPQFEPLK